MIDVGRCNELIDGSAPETVAEEFFIYFFQGAINGSNLGDLLSEVGEDIDERDSHQLEMIIAGYATGQTQRDIDSGILKTDIH